jgi:hypothetical protein
MGPRTLENYKDALGVLKKETIDPEAGRARVDLMETIDCIQIHNRYEIGLVIRALERRQNFDAAIALAEKVVCLYKDRVQGSPNNGRNAELLEWEQNRSAKLREEQARQ